MRKAIDKIIEIMCTLIMGYMVLAVCWQVITRFVLKNPRPPPRKSCAICSSGPPWSAAHTRTAAASTCPSTCSPKALPRGQKILDIGVQLVVIAFCVVVMILGDLRLVETTFNQISSALHLPMPYVYASILVGGVLIVFYAVIFILEDLKAIRQAGDEIPAAKQ